jgi:hypothetical protein
LIAADSGGGREIFTLAEADEMILPGDEIAGGVETAFEEVIAGGTIVIVVKVVFASPEKFDGNADLLGDGTGFEHVVVGEATAEAASGAFHVDDDLFLRDFENLGHEFAAALGSLRGRPEFKFAVVVVGEAVLRLHGGVGEEGIIIGSGYRFGGGFESGEGVAIFAKNHGGRFLPEFIGLSEETFAALLRGGTLFPSDFQFLACGIGLPPSVGDDGDAAVESEKIGSAGERENVADAGLFFDVLEIGGGDFSGEDWALFVDGPEHVGDAIVDGVERFAGDDGEIVDAGSGVADDLVILWIFEGDGLEIGRTERGDIGGESAVGDGTIR